MLKVRLMGTKNDIKWFGKILTEGFGYSAEAYISHREDIGIIKKSNKIFSLYLERFFSFLSRKNIASLDTL